MATFATAWQKGIEAMDELADIPSSGLTRLSVLLQSTITQSQYDAVVLERDQRQAAINAMKAAAQADKDADAASVAGQGVLNAAGGF